MADPKTKIPPTQADDGDALFAAMADDAIRRMLDEGDAPPARAVTPAATTLPEVELDPDEAAALAAGEDEHHGPEQGVTTMPSDAELDALLRGEEPAALAEPVEAAADEPELTRDQAAPSPAAAALAAELDAEPVAPTAPVAPAVVPAATKVEAGPAKPRGTPLWLAPLVWLNAPLSRAPQPARDALGKVGLVTLLNAAAVIVYALVIRR